jgi:hypothetical protein
VSIGLTRPVCRGKRHHLPLAQQHVLHLQHHHLPLVRLALGYPLRLEAQVLHDDHQVVELVLISLMVSWLAFTSCASRSTEEVVSKIYRSMSGGHPREHGAGLVAQLEDVQTIELHALQDVAHLLQVVPRGLELVAGLHAHAHGPRGIEDELLAELVRPAAVGRPKVPRAGPVSGVLPAGRAGLLAALAVTVVVVAAHVRLAGWIVAR